MLNRRRFCFPIAIIILLANGGIAPSTEPTAVVVKLSDAVALSDLQVDDRQVALTDKLKSPPAGHTIYFGELDQYASDDDDEPSTTVPIIAIKNGEAWLAVPLGGEGLTNAGWKYVGGGPDEKEIWGVLDTAAGKSRSRFVLAHSQDSGEMFQLIVIKKPAHEMEFFDFAMDDSGHGRASLSLGKTTGEFKQGLYHYETIDGGKTWSVEPRFEPDVMKRSDPVDEEEQPEAQRAKSRT